MKKPAAFTLSVLMLAQTLAQSSVVYADSGNRFDEIVDQAVTEGEAQRAQVRMLLRTMDQNLGQTEAMLEHSIKTGEGLRKMNLIVDSITLGSAVTYLATTKIPFMKLGRTGEKVLQVTANTTAISTVVGLVSGQALLFGRDELNGRLPAWRVRDFSNSALAQLNRVNVDSLPEEVRSQINQTKESLKLLKANPGSQDRLEQSLEGISALSLVGGFYAIAKDLHDCNYMLATQMTVVGAAVATSSVVTRMATYLTVNDQEAVLARVKAARESVRHASEQLN